jgi:preprotein translocase subunit SecE
MDKTNQKILTLSFATVSVLVWGSISLLFKTFAGTFGIVARLHDIDFIKHGMPVLIGVILFLALQFNKKVLLWGDDVALEIRKVVWPSKKDTIAMTIVVIVMVLISTLVITGLDFASGFVINYLRQ